MKNKQTDLVDSQVQFASPGAPYPLMLLRDLEDEGIIQLGRGKVISRKDIDNNPGDYPVYSSSAIANGEFGRYSLYMFTDEMITWSIDGGGRFFYRPAHKYSVTNVSGWLEVLRADILNTRYLFHVLDSAWSLKHYDYTFKAHPSVIRNDYAISLPPLSVQEEIVRILDTFTELDQTLNTELENRGKQFEWYRDELMDFEKGHIREGLEFIPLGRLISANVGGGTPSTKKKEYWNGNIPWASIGDMTASKIFLDSTRAHITDSGLANSNTHLASPGTFIVATRIMPGLAKIAGSAVAINQDLRALYLKDDVNPKYLFYYFQTINVVGTGTTVKGITIKKLEQFLIPLPPLSVQEEIVRILDTFTDLDTGLDAEIAARRKQYEYYRDKLLTFESAETA